MRCPKCGNLEDKVIDSRSAKAGAAIRRRRECLACQHRFTTYEEIERRDLRVIKRDGRHEPFDRQKLLGGMVKACEKRPVSYDALERAVEEIIQELEQAYDHEVPTNAIGIRVMERLHSLDEVKRAGPRELPPSLICCTKVQAIRSGSPSRPASLRTYVKPS